MRPLRWTSFIIFLWTSCWFAPPPAKALDSKLRIASFNIQVFGQSKVSNPLVTQALVQILDRYDLIFIQEIRDSNNTAIFDLLDRLNAKSDKNYKMQLSDRLGRTVSKEQYAFIYNEDRVTPLDMRTFDDKDDLFEREPYIGHFRAGELDFSVVGIHVTPRAVKQELNALSAVYRDVAARYDHNSIIVLGDMNADCDYYNPSLGFQFFDDEATELIPENTDTTVGSNLCTYDRALAFGNMAKRASVGAAFNFQDAFQMRIELAKEISDHYPIEFTIKTDAE